jgi:hypothetical protein
MPSGGSTTDRILSMSLYFRIRSFTVVDVSEGDAFTWEVKCLAALRENRVGTRDINNHFMGEGAVC